MIKNYLIVAIRNLRKNTLFTFLTILGLAVGIASSLFIFQFVLYERSYDDFHENKNIYRIVQESYKDEVFVDKIAYTSPGVGPRIKEEFAEIISYSRLAILGAIHYTSSNGINFSEEKVFFAENDFLKMYSLDFVKENKEYALKNPNSVIISTSMAEKYFGVEDPIGQVIRFESWIGDFRCTVAGVFKDLPRNTHIKFDCLISYETLISANKRVYDQHWNYNAFFNLIELTEDVNVKDFSAKLPAFVKKYKNSPEDLNKRYDYILQHMPDIHLHSDYQYEAEVNGSATTTRILFVISILILLIAFINNINMIISRSLDRAKEVGVRKVAGGFRKQLITQFLLESAIVNFISIVFSLILLLIALPIISPITDGKVNYTIFTHASFYLMILVVFIFGTFASGLYPAFILSSFKPLTVLRGKLTKTTKGIFLRKVLVIFQFTASVVLIICALTINKQIEFMKSQDLGIDINNTIAIRAPYTRNDSTYVGRMIGLKLILESYPQIKSFSGCRGVPGTDYLLGLSVRKEGDDISSVDMHSFIVTDYDYYDNLNIKLAAGRFFSEDYQSDFTAVLVNEASLKLLGYKTPEEAINKRVIVEGRRNPQTIIGVVKNYHQTSLKDDYLPLMYRLRLTSRFFYIAKLDGEKINDAIAIIEEKWQSIFPDIAFNYFFVDDYFNEQYKNEENTLSTINLFSIVCVIIACFGLFGISYINILLRTREIALRKVNGAMVTDIVILNVKDNIYPVIISNILGWPLAFLLVSKWLDNYRFRIDMPWMFFGAATILLLIISIVTIVSHTISVAKTNPINSLKSE